MRVLESLQQMSGLPNLERSLVLVVELHLLMGVCQLMKTCLSSYRSEPTAFKHF